MYKIIDNQGGGLMQDRECETIKDVIDNLASFHSVDWSGETEDSIPLSIEEYLSRMDNDTERLNFLLDYGDWDIEKV